MGIAEEAGEVEGLFVLAVADAAEALAGLGEGVNGELRREGLCKRGQEAEELGCGGGGDKDVACCRDWGRQGRLGDG